MLLLSNFHIVAVAPPSPPQYLVLRRRCYGPQTRPPVSPVHELDSLSFESTRYSY